MVFAISILVGGGGAGFVVVSDGCHVTDDDNDDVDIDVNVVVVGAVGFKLLRVVVIRDKRNSRCSLSKTNNQQLHKYETTC